MKISIIYLVGKLKVLNLVSMYNKIKTIEELESQVKGEIKSFQENHQQLSNQEKSIKVVYNNSESNVNSEILINDSVSVAT